MTMIEVSSVLDCPPGQAAALLSKTATFLHVVRPVLAVANRHELPERFVAGDRLELRMRLFGILPQPRHRIEIVELAAGPAGGRAQTRESGGFIRMWNHTLLAEPIPGDPQRTRYTDRVDIEAGLGLTRVVAALSTRLCRHRQRRLRALAERVAAADGRPSS